MLYFAITAALLVSSVLGTHPESAGSRHCDTKTVLGPRLSAEASMIFPGDASYDELLIRASSPRIRPTFSVVVEPATQRDVQETLKFAHHCSLPFLTVSSGHGWQSTLSHASGIQLNMHKLQSIHLSPSGTTVNLGGGTNQRLLIQTLADLGKQAVTANCECSAVIGPLMGGGHAALQGQHGFVSDGLNSAEVVLYNGTVVRASREEHKDLFWALRGAGHNFGVVTNFEIRVYDTPEQNWTITNFVYTQDKLEAFLETVNEVDEMGNHPGKLILQGAITRIPSIDAEQPVITYHVSYLGTLEEAEPYVARYRAVGPVSEKVYSVTYRDFFTVIKSGLDDEACRRDGNIFTHAISLEKYNTTAMRTAFGYFSELTADERYITSAWLVENYGYQGVRKQEYEASAVPAAERDLPVLTAPLNWWAGDEAEAREKAEKYGRLMRATLAAGERSKDPHVYLNYAIGSESLEQVYSRERLKKLRRVKQQYDPENKFGFYMPIV